MDKIIDDNNKIVGNINLDNSNILIMISFSYLHFINFPSVFLVFTAFLLFV